MADLTSENDTTASASWAGGLDEGLGTSRYKEYELAPYVQMVSAHVPQNVWSGVFFSWLSLKGHLQGLRQFDRSECFATVAPDGGVHVTFAVVWEGADTMAEWIRNGFDVETMLREMGVAENDIHVQLMRDFS
jgi:hypothetical protein